MNISKNIQWIINAPAQWNFYTNRSYRVLIRRADPQQIYNVPGKPGVMYNFMEDVYEKVMDNGYVVTGTMGEMWPIGADTIKKYNIEPSKVKSEPVLIDTVELYTVYAAVMIPYDTPFTLEVDYGEKAMLHGNRPGLEHGNGDFILVAAKPY